MFLTFSCYCKTCPKFLNNDKLNCVTSCTNYVFNNLYCQDTCNVGYMFTDAQNQKNCVTVCPDIYKNVDVNRNCLLACPLYQIGINCVDQCTGSYPYLLKPLFFQPDNKIILYFDNIIKILLILNSFYCRCNIFKFRVNIDNTAKNLSRLKIIY